MKKMSHPFLYFVLFLAATSLACSALAEGAAPAATEEVVSEAPTIAPPPTQKPTDVPPPTAVPPTAGPQEFFTEEFGTGSDQSNWAYYVSGSGSDTNLSIEPSEQGLTFDLGDEDLYIYYIYDAKMYRDVKLTMVAENLGRNNNNVSLVCGFDSDQNSWYEFSVESGGVWYLYSYNDGYVVIGSGGTNELKQGKATNTYGMTCESNAITIYVNGSELKSIPLDSGEYGEGQVGFNISSLNVLPIIVDVKSFDITLP
jgi:hypothetical protein